MRADITADITAAWESLAHQPIQHFHDHRDAIVATPVHTAIQSLIAIVLAQVLVCLLRGAASKSEELIPLRSLTPTVRLANVGASQFG